jgi:cytochrome b pre-mRNA-processing protein 3
MLKLLKTPNPFEEPARRVYAVLLTRVRQPFFYETMEVPDSFTGRFDLLLAHVFLVIRRTLDAKDFNQALFDVLFADMDQTLRERGIGDMGVPKHMKRMMKAFNGRMHAYHDAFADEGAFREVLRRNLYGSAEVSEAALERMSMYLKKMDAALQRQDAGGIVRGNFELDSADEQG